MEDIQEITSKYATRRNIPKAKYKEDTSEESDSEDYYVYSKESKKKKSKYIKKKTKSKYKESSSEGFSFSEYKESSSEGFSFSEDEGSKSEHATDNEDEEPKHTEEKIFKKTYKKKTAGVGKHEALSAYELSLEQKRAEKMAFLKSIQMDEVKSGFSEIFGALKQKRPYIKKDHISLPKREKSERIKGSGKIDFTERGQLKKAVINARKELMMNGTVIPPQLPLSEALSRGFYEDFVEDIHIETSEYNSVKFIPYDISSLKQLSLYKVGSVQKSDFGRMLGLTWYPSMEKTILAAGLSDGNINIWNVDSDSPPYIFKIHSKKVSNIQFNPFDSVQLITSSYDGCLRCCDMVNQMSFQVYTEQEISFTHFDFLSATTYLVSLFNGAIALIDKRAAKDDCVKIHPCHESPIKTVNLHPVNNNVFLTATRTNGIGLWDLRKLQKKPVLEISHHRSVTSAFFSPITGNSILTTFLNNNVSIFDSTNLTEWIKHKKHMQHFHDSYAKSRWLPNSEEAFVVESSESRPGQIQIFDKDMKVYHTVINKNVNQHLHHSTVHPFRPILAACNMTSKFFVFSEIVQNS